MKTTMKTFWSLLILAVVITTPVYSGQDSRPAVPQAAKIETSYDSSKDRTTVRLAPVLISAEQDKYRSLHMAPAFSYPGHDPRTPEIIDFELRTVVKGKLFPVGEEQLQALRELAQQIKAGSG
jgi:hypothetical protein